MTVLATGALTRIVRRRAAPGAYRDGIWVPGRITEATLLASVQPVGLEDVDGVAGAQFSDRRRIFVGLLDDAAGPPLVAAYEGRGGDVVVIDGADFKVESAMLWPSHVEAVVLREP